tara:strand:+ start:1560 stop:2516 length:957 start_codon:yes stop_codon:yes gene_type:complete
MDNMATTGRWIMNKWMNIAWKSIGIASPHSDHMAVDIVPYWIVINVTKLTIGSLLWSTAYFMMDDEECWGTYSQYRFTTMDMRCSHYAVILSGLLACIGVLGIQVVLERALYPENYRSSTLLLTLLGISLFITFSLWGVFNLLAFWLAHSGGSHDDAYAGEYDLDIYMASSILAFLLNAFIFYLCFNSMRALVIRISLLETCTWMPYVTENDMWRCDILYMCVLGGSLYGLSFGAFFAHTFLARKHIEIALCNALGSLLSTVMTITPTHLLPMFVWMRVFYKDGDEHIDGVDWDTSLEGSRLEGQTSADVLNNLHSRL